MRRPATSSGFYTAALILGLISIFGAAFVSSGCSGIIGNEAERFAKKYWDERLTNCGGTYVVHGPPFPFNVYPGAPYPPPQN